MITVLGGLLLAIVVLVLLVGGLHLWVGGALPAPRAQREVDHDPRNDRFVRDHLSHENPDTVARYFAERPDLLPTRCPHLAAHRELITALTGPMSSPEVVAWLCTLCGERTHYVPGTLGQ